MSTDDYMMWEIINGMSDSEAILFGVLMVAFTVGLALFGLIDWIKRYRDGDT
jgi:hypothetical protein